MSNERDDGNVRRATEPTLARTLIEDRGGYPAHEPRTEGQGDEGLLRVGFRGRDEDLKEISWDQFEAEFEEKDLALVYAEDDSEIYGDEPPPSRATRGRRGVTERPAAARLRATPNE